MSPEDRELLQSLRRQQQDLQQQLERLDSRVAEFGRRLQTPPLPPALPPLPELHLSTLPPMPASDEIVRNLPPVPLPPAPVSAFESVSPSSSVNSAPAPSLESQLGWWLTRIGAVLFLITIVFIGVLPQVQHFLGALGRLGIMGLISVAAILCGQRFERKNKMLRWSRPVLAAGLAGLYFTFYAAASIDSLRVIHSPLLGGVLLLLWSAYVLILAERRRSQTIALFAVVLAYVSSALNPVIPFTMAADLMLAGTAVLFMLRNGWAALSYLSLAGTYLALLRHLIFDENGELVLDTSRALPFGPHAIYLVGAWALFTAAVLLSTAATFRGGKRLSFLSLNNGAAAGLLLFTAYISGYASTYLGRVLFVAGLVLLATSRLTAWMRRDAGEVSGAYLAQGIALFTGGLMALYAGTTRSVLLILETFFLGAASTFSRDRVLAVSAYVTAFFSTLLLLWEIAVNAHSPWLLGFGGGLVMVLNAWWSRRALADFSRGAGRIILSASYYCALGLGLMATSLATELSDSLLPVALASGALFFSFVIYLIPLLELPPLAQTFLIGAQILVLFPTENGEVLPWWTTAFVAAATLLMLAWWSFQRVARYGRSLELLHYLYALALVGLAYHAIHPHVSAQNWLIDASLLSVAFLIFGSLTRIWPVAATGQIFLFLSLYEFFGGDARSFPWTWWAAAIPLVCVFATGRGLHAWLRSFHEIAGRRRRDWRAVASLYHLIALAMLVRWILAVVPPLFQITLFLALGTLLLAWNVKRSHAFGVRAGFFLSGLGTILYVANFPGAERLMANGLIALAIFCLLSQPGILAHGRRVLVTKVESWALLLISAATGWLFCSGWIEARWGASYLTMGWALYALFLFLFGLLVQERRQRACGIAILMIALLRAGLVDSLGLSSIERVLTFLVMTLVTLGLGFICIRYADRLKMWL